MFLVKLLILLATIKQGFSAQWVCSPTAIGTQSFTIKQTSGRPGVIQSPNYPNSYPNNIDCVWKITVPSGRKIKLTFSRLDLQYKSLCTADYLELRDGSSSFSSRIGRYCGTSLPSAQYSSGRYMWVKFHSDRSVTRRGFSVTFQAVTVSTTSTSGSSAGSIGGSVVGIVFFIIFVIFLSICCRRRRRPGVLVAAPVARSTTVMVSNVNVNQQQVSVPPPQPQQPYPQAMAAPTYYPAGYQAPSPDTSAYAPPPQESPYPLSPQGTAYPPPNQASAYFPHSQGSADPPPPYNYDFAYTPTHQESSNPPPHQGAPFPAPHQGTPYSAPHQGAPYPSPHQETPYPPPNQGAPYPTHAVPYDPSPIPPKQ